VTGPTAADKETLASFLGRMASATPAVGGGAAAALAGAAAAALLAMVAGIAARHAASSTAAELAARISEADALRARLGELIEQDVHAYAAVIEARRLAAPARGDAVRDALVRATEVPLEIARAAARALDAAAAVVPLARPSTVGDLAVAAALAGAALESAALTAGMNLTALDDAAFVQATRAELDRMVAHGAGLRRRITEAAVPRA
jgi:formiminotetrahydrofolate cyclodeaminase